MNGPGESKPELQDFVRFLRGDTTAQVQVNAGGVGVWIAVTAAMVIAGVSIVNSMHMTRELARADAERKELRDQVQRMNDYLAAIYMQAPHLKPKDKQ